MSIRTTCPYCGVGCGVLASPDGTIKGDPDHPANFGRLCSKGAALGETISLDGRLLEPKVSGRKTDWNTALDLVAKQFSEAISDHGPDSVAFYVSGQLLTEDYYVANKLMKGFIGSANIDTNSRLCMASSVAGHKRAFGSDTVPGTYADLEEADVIVLVGSNLAWCHPVLSQRIQAAKDARPDMRIVNVDPRRTATTQLADIHLQIAPDGDIALFNGLLAHLADTRAFDLAYVSDHVTGCHEAVDAARATDPLLSGLNAQELQFFFHLWSTTEKVVTVYSQGVNQSTHGTDKVNAILNCHLATGRIGKPGCGPFSVTGQPNAMGGREVGGLSNMLANHLAIENPHHRSAVQNFWQSPTICTHPGLKAVDLFQACADGQIKALWVMSTNPAVSMPNANDVATAIGNVPFTVVSEIIAKTDTGDLADVLLPATGWGEKNGTVTNSERRISRQRAFLPAPGAARADWKIICDVACRMGWTDAFSYDDPAAIFEEYVSLWKATSALSGDLDLGVFSEIDYEALPPTQWPSNGHRFFGRGGFNHPDGRARMLPIAALDQYERKGFRLNTGRTRDQWHTMSRTGKSARLGRHLAEPFVEINPMDASELGLGTAELLEVDAAGQRAVFRALPTDRTRVGTLFAPIHWTRAHSTSSWVNAVVPARVDPVSGQPALKAGVVSARPFKAAWYGFLASASPITPTGDYCAVAKTQTGWQSELASRVTPGGWSTLLSELIDAAGGELSFLEDRTTGSIRLARSTDGTITQLFFASRDPIAISRAHVITQIGNRSSSLAALAGIPGGDVPDQGAVICSCMSVGLNSLRAAIAKGAQSVDALGSCTGAGTSCGSCKPELKALLVNAEQKIAAE